MYLYIELWRAREAWLRLTVEERQSKLNELLELAQREPITGVVPISFTKVGEVFLLDGVTEQPIVLDNRAARPTGFRYAGAWMIPTLELVYKFEKRTDALGWWFDYFEQQNGWGLMDVQATVGDMIAGGEAAPSGYPASGPGRLARTEQELRRLRAEVEELRKGAKVALRA